MASVRSIVLRLTTLAARTLLADTKVTDAGLPYLRGLRCLQELEVPISISDSGIWGLQSDLPGVGSRE
jgi:hypothetical protein